MDSRNTVIRTVLVNSLLEQARQVVDSDWEAADAIVQEVLHLEPTHAPAQSLASRIADRKRDDFIAWCLAQARRMQTDGDIDGATAVVAQGLGAYPKEPRLLQLQATLQRALAEKDRQTARIPPREQSPRTATNIPVAAAPPEPPPATLREDRTIEFPPPVLPAVATPPPPVEPEPQPAVPVAQTPPPEQPTPPPPVPKPPAAAVTPVPPAPMPAPPVTRPPMPNQSRRLLVGTAAAAGLLLLIALIVTVSHHRSTGKPVAASKYAILVHSTPEGAEIKVNGDTCGVSTCRLELPPGNYQAEAQLTGYQNVTSPFTVAPGGVNDFNLTLSPLPPRATIFTDLANGTVTLDDSPAGQIEAGGATIPNLSPGKHVLSVKSGDSTVSIPIEISPGGAPTLTGPIDTKSLRCFVVAGYGAGARVYGSDIGSHVTLDGKPMGDLVAAGVPLEGLAPGSHELALDTQTSQHDKIVFESQPSPTLYVSLGGSQNLGVLTVETNQDQAQLYIDGQKYNRDTTRGKLVVYLPPKKYSLVVQKDGYAPSAAQTVEIKRGAESKVSFILSMPKAILAIHHAPPGTDVLVDNIRVGSAHPDGEFEVGGIDPGRHTVTLRHDTFKPLQSDQIFLSGKTVELQGPLEAIITTGTLRFEISPAGLDAHVHIQRDGEDQGRDVSGSSVTVPEGHYTVTASAPQYVTTTTSIQVNAGATAVVTLPLRHVEAPKAPPTAPAVPTFGLEDWLSKTGGWSQQGDMIVRRSGGGDYVLAPLDISQGTVRFTVVSLKGKHVEWVVAFRDAKNFLFYELDDKNLTRYEVRNGSKSGQIKVPHGLDRKKPMGISLAITPQSVVTSVSRGQFVDLDKWDVVGETVHGRFGFHITGSDEIGLEDFHAKPN